MSDTKLTQEVIDRAVELINEKEFLHLERLGVALCIMRLKDGTFVVDGDTEHTDSYDLALRYQAAYERAVARIVTHLPMFNDRQDKTAG